MREGGGEGGREGDHVGWWILASEQHGEKQEKGRHHIIREECKKRKRRRDEIETHTKQKRSNRKEKPT